MLGNIMCWIIVFGLLLSESIDRNDMFIKLIFAIGFILTGTLCKLVDVYREIHKPIDDKNSAVMSDGQTVED